jgi:hypothetical protein
VRVAVDAGLVLTPKWGDGTAVGGCSFMIHVRHAAAAIASGLCVKRHSGGARCPLDQAVSREMVCGLTL